MLSLSAEGEKMAIETLLVMSVPLLALALVATILVVLRLARRDGALPPQVEARLLALEGGVARGEAAIRDEAARAREEARGTARELREEVTGAFRALGETVRNALADVAAAQQVQLQAIRTENSEKLDEMRRTVDEKLHSTLEQRLGAGFRQINESLEQVFRSMGEMQALAVNVGDLKRVLTNVKARGTWGEVSLGNLLEQVLSPDQYERNVEIQPGSGRRVEFAIRLPGDGERHLWLPLDAKFPMEDYQRLEEARECGDAVAAEVASRALEVRMRGAAKDICARYVQPPHSTDFAVMFVPTEGLFAEILRRPGLVDALQRECQIMVAGPTTLFSLLTALRMGFRSLAIQQRSAEVWRVLGAVKHEFGKFGAVLDKVGKKLDEAQNVLNDDLGRRHRAMDRKLRAVEVLPEAEATVLLALEAVTPLADEDDDTREAAE
jgi:DNA recombination protein RmuC